MPYHSEEQANLSANVKTVNLLAGDKVEFVTVNSVVNVFAVVSAGGVHIAVHADNDIAVDDVEIVAIGTTLDKSQHLIDSFIVGAGTRLSLFAREVDGTATTDLLFGVEVLPVKR